MNIATRILTALLAIIAFILGGHGAIEGLAVEAPSILDNEYRFFAGVWFGVGLGLAYCVLHLERTTLLFRALMLTIFMGGIARIIGLSEYAAEAQIIAPIAIELVAPILLVWMQSRSPHITNL